MRRTIGLTIAILCAMTVAARAGRATDVAGDAKPASAKPLGAFHAFGRVTQTLAGGSTCPNLTCNSGDVCTAMNFTGPVSATTFNKGVVTGCVNIDATIENNNGTGGVCSQMSGTASINGAKGNAANFLIGGQFCTLPSATFTIEASGGYAVSGGTGNLSGASGNGHFSISFFQGAPQTGAGSLDMTGNYAP